MNELKKELIETLEEYNRDLEQMWWNTDSGSCCRDIREKQEKVLELIHKLNLITAVPIRVTK